MRNFLFYSFLIVLLSACSLNSEQEMELNNSLTKFIKVRNEGDALMYAGLTHPTIVETYNSEGREVMKKRFKIMPSVSKDQYSYNEEEVSAGLVFWQTPYQQEVKQEEQKIQVKYFISLQKDYIGLDSNKTIFALSENNGQGWVFAEEQDYFSERYPANMRLFKEE